MLIFSAVRLVVCVIAVIMSSPRPVRSLNGHQSLSQHGDVVLQGLFPITYSDGQRCTRLYKDGVMWAMAMVYAVDSINHSPLLPNISLGYKIDNTCQNIPSAMSNAIEIVAKYRPNSVCYSQGHYCKDRQASGGRVSAVIGPAMSWIAIPLASLLGLYEIPQISYAATSRILSDNTRYKSFLRTVPSDEYQARAMADFVRYFKWNYVFLIASDDDYGKMGASAFKTTARSLNVCIANDEYIPFGSDEASEYIHNTLVTLKQSRRAKVVIVFSYADQGELLLKEAERLNITDRTWVTSDAWSSSVTGLNLTKTMLEGIFTFSIRSKLVDGFMGYVKGLRIRDVTHIPWFKEYIEAALGCVSNGSAGSVKPVCDPSSTLPPDHSISTEAIANVIDAVNVTAHALSSMLSCTHASCRNVPITPHTLLEYVRNTSFQGADNTHVEFDNNGDRTDSGYNIRNVQVEANGSIGYREVGVWSRVGDETYFTITSSLIRWNSGTRPQSNCFRVCQPGERVVGQSECCWNCQKCEKGWFSARESSLSCAKCNDSHYTNSERTACIARTTVYFTLLSPAGISVFSVSMIGIIVTTVIAGIFTKYRATPVIASSTPFHLALFFAIVYMSFLFSMSFTFKIPSNYMCAAAESMHELLTMLYSAFLLSKTRAVNRTIRSAVPHLETMRADWSQALLVGSLVVLQLTLITTRQSMDPSVTHYLNQADTTRLLECEQRFSSFRIIAVSLPCAILVVATFLSFRERENQENFNQAKFTSFATILLCIIIVAYIPTYRYVIGMSRVLVVTFTTFVTAFSCMGCLFIPKLYIILVRPEQNIAKGNNGKDTDNTPEPQNNSVHTSTSDGLSPDLNTNPKAMTRSTNPNLLDVHDTPANQVTSFWNHGAETSDEGPTVNDSTNQGPGKQRKRSRTNPGHIQITIALSTVIEASEDGVGLSPEQSHRLNRGYGKDIDCSTISKRETPTAFTVI